MVSYFHEIGDSIFFSFFLFTASWRLLYLDLLMRCIKICPGIKLLGGWLGYCRRIRIYPVRYEGTNIGVKWYKLGQMPSTINSSKQFNMRACNRECEAGEHEKKKDRSRTPLGSDM